MLTIVQYSEEQHGQTELRQTHRDTAAHLQDRLGCVVDGEDVCDVELGQQILVLRICTSSNDRSC